MTSRRRRRFAPMTSWLFGAVGAAVTLALLWWFG
jgi:hypothetical protein